MTAPLATAIARVVGGSLRRRLAASLGAAVIIASAALAESSAHGVASLPAGLAALGGEGFLVFLLVDWTIRRRVAAVQRSLARLASGDNDTGCDITGADEVGRLAADTDRVRLMVTGCLRHIDASIERLLNVSQALTTTTGGIDRLQDAILATTATTAGVGATAMLFTRCGEELRIARQGGAVRQWALGGEAQQTLLGKRLVRIDEDFHHILAVPMLYQDRVVGALVTITLTPVFESDERTLEALANNAAVALENTRLFEQERETVTRLTQLNQLKSDLLSTMQHELRTPVFAIQGQLELLALAWERWDDAMKREAIRAVDASTRMLADLVETIVDFSLLNAETVAIAVQPVAVSDAVSQAVQGLPAGLPSERSVRLEVDVDERLTLEADPKRLGQVLRALVDNAVKFTPEGGYVVIRARAEGESGIVTVSDNGIGIGAEALPHVFDQFFQEDNSRTRRFGGMGMGLTLARRLCEAHGAKVDVSSEVGRGTVATVRWPLADAARLSAKEDGLIANLPSAS